MKVKELILLLEGLDPEKKICSYEGCDIGPGYYYANAAEVRPAKGKEEIEEEGMDYCLQWYYKEK